MQSDFDNYEYALFKITDKEKFREFMKKYLSVVNSKDTSDFGYLIQVLGCGKEPFEWENYVEYLYKVGALDDGHEFHLTLDEWILMGRPKEDSDSLSRRIEAELT